jgi:DHA1 family bicyclomycin/chloramphenicol resistance-like MFS transporter
MTFYLIGHSFTNPVCLAAAVGPFPKIAGTASALLGCTQLVLAAIVGQVFMRAFAGTQLALAGGIALFGCGLFAAYLVLVRRLGRG